MYTIHHLPSLDSSSTPQLLLDSSTPRLLLIAKTKKLLLATAMMKLESVNSSSARIPKTVMNE